MMTAEFVAFGQLLRDNGVRVGADEMAMALEAIQLPEVGALHSPETFLAVLTTTLAKSEEDAETLAELFSLHFLSPHARGKTPSLEDALMARGLNADDAKELAEALRDQIQSSDGDALAEIAEALLEGDTWELRRALEEAARGVDLSRMQSELQVGYFTQQLLTRLGIDDIEARLRDALGGVGSASGEGGAMLLKGLVDERLLSLRRQARQVTATAQKKQNFTKERLFSTESAVDRAFARLVQEDLAKLRPEVERLAQRLLTRTRAREKKARRGRIDVGKTLRKNLAYDGVPITPQFKRRRKERPDLVMLCDISDSVRAASLFMLELVYAIGELFRRVRSFVFVDEIAESTDLFQNESIEDAMEAILGNALIPAYASSDYGAALDGFAASHLESLTQKTTVVILGDGRCNQRDPRVAVVEQMRQRAKSVLWFCPEERRTWGLGDSEMPAFERACTDVFVVRNLRQLGHAVDCVGL